MTEDAARSQSPLNPLPPAVWALVLPIVILEMIFQFGATGLMQGTQGDAWRLTVLMRLAFSPEQLLWMYDAGQYPLSEVARLIGYSFVHVSFTHAAFAAVFVLALGKFVGEVFHPAALIALFLGSAVGAALVYTGVLASVEVLRDETGRIPSLVGAYPGAFGLIGAFSFILWIRLGASGAPAWRAFSLIGMLMLVRLVFGLVLGSGPDWVADLAGFAIGFLLSFVLVPGGPAKLLAYLRER